MPISVNAKITWNSTAITDPRREAIVGKDNFQDPWFLRKGLERSRCVGLVANIGTGWLIAPSLVMTNWHVLRRVQWAAGKSIFFNFEQQEDGSVAETVRVNLDPNQFFIAVEELDYAVVATVGTPGNDLGFVNIKNTGALNEDTRVNIIQHPNAGMKKFAIRDNGLRSFDGKIIQYWTDTEHGSSGSPVFDDRWEIIGLHYRHDFATDPDESKIVYNEAHDINAIRADLLSKFPLLLN